MGKVLKWSAIVIAALVGLAFFQGASEVRQWFVVVIGVNVYLAYVIAKQLDRSHQAIERRLEVLFKLGRASNGFRDEDA